MIPSLAGFHSFIRSRTFSALGVRDFRRFFMGQGVSLVGTWLQGAAVSWMVYEKTRSELTLGIVGAASLLPGLFVGLFAGFVADRVPPRPLIMLMQAAQMALAFFLAFLIGTGIDQIWHLVCILALNRVCVTFEMPSRQVFMYELVGREHLGNAIALNSGLFNASRVLGPTLAAFIYALAGPTTCFLINGLSYIAALTAVYSIELPAAHQQRQARGLGGILDGVSYLFQNKRVGLLFLLMNLFGIIGMGYDSMIPAYASGVVQTGIKGYGLLLGCSGMGATCGALLVATVGTGHRRERLLLAGMAIFAIALGASARIPPWIGEHFSHRTSLAVAACGMLGIGLGAVLFYAAAQTIIQNVLPDSLRGRVMAIWLISYSGSVPLGSLWIGRVADSYGIPFAMTTSSTLGLLLALVGLAGWIALRRKSEPARQAT